MGAENQYANVLAQIGGSYVHVTSILDNPNTDPHTFEASTTVAEEVGRADLVVQNGVGYDSFMDNIESASPSPERKVIVAQHVLGLPDSTPNPHLWYSPKTMPAVAKVMATDLSALEPDPPRRTSKPDCGPSTPPSRRGWRPSPHSGTTIRGHRWPPPSRWPTTCSRRWA